MEWDLLVKDRLKLVIAKIPIFHRAIAEAVVTKKAEELAGLRGVKQVEEEDVIGAFFSDVPSPFYSMMVRLLEQSSFDYRKYGFPKNDKQR